MRSAIQRYCNTFEYGCVSLRMRFFSQNFGTIKRILPGSSSPSHREGSGIEVAENIASYASAIHNHGTPLENCCGFIDGTVRRIARLKKNQRNMYNGHKRVHSMKFQSVVIANDLIANLAGPFEGKRHDSTMLYQSGLLPQLQQHAFYDGAPLCRYGDPAYPLRVVHLQGPFKDRQLTPEMQSYNKAMSAVRVSVEWMFGCIRNYRL